MNQPRSIFSRELLPASLAIFSTAALASFESLGVAAALPDIATDLGNVALLPWVVTAYLLTSSLATVLAGPFIDSLGVNRMFRISVAMLTASAAAVRAGASIRCLGVTRMFRTSVHVLTAPGCGIGFAPSIEILIVRRLVQGLGGGLILASGTAAVSLVFPGHLVSRAFAANSAVWGVMGVAGPAVAAAMLTFLSWHWIFYVNLPLGALALYAGWKAMPGPYGEASGRFDAIGMLLLAAITVATLMAVEAL